jgi:C4-dicarboxylate-specific signal transduction histidine kinase
VAQVRQKEPGTLLTLETSNGPSTRHDRDGQDHLVLVARPAGVNATASSDHAFALFSESDRSGGLGLAQINDTARRAGGNATLEQMPQGGLALRLALPLASCRKED